MLNVISGTSKKALSLEEFLNFVGSQPLSATFKIAGVTITGVLYDRIENIFYLTTENPLRIPQVSRRSQRSVKLRVLLGETLDQSRSTD